MRRFLSSSAAAAAASCSKLLQRAQPQLSFGVFFLLNPHWRIRLKEITFGGGASSKRQRGFTREAPLSISSSTGFRSLKCRWTRALVKSRQPLKNLKNVKILQNKLLLKFHQIKDYTRKTIFLIMLHCFKSTFSWGFLWVSLLQIRLKRVCARPLVFCACAPAHRGSSSLSGALSLPSLARRPTVLRQSICRWSRDRRCLVAR